jgi:hypothetical protein
MTWFFGSVKTLRALRWPVGITLTCRGTSVLPDQKLRTGAADTLDVDATSSGPGDPFVVRGQGCVTHVVCDHSDDMTVSRNDLQARRRQARPRP